MFATEGKKEKIWLPIIIIAVFVALSAVWYTDYQELILRPAYEEAAQKYGAEVVQYYRQIVNTVPPVASAVLSAVVLLATQLGIAAVSSLIMLALLRFIFKQEVKFRALFSIALFMGAITAIEYPLTYFAAVSLDSTASIFNLGVIMGAEHDGAFMTALAGISVFSIAQYIALYLALTKRASLQEEPPAKGKAAAAAITCVVVLFAIAFVISVVSAMFATNVNLADTMNNVYQQTHRSY